MRIPHTKGFSQLNYTCIPAVVDMTDDAIETTKEALQRRIRMLQSVYGSEEGWRNVIIGRDKKNISSKVEILRFARDPYFSAVRTNWRWQT